MGDGCDFARWEEDEKRDQSKQLRVECALGVTLSVTVVSVAKDTDNYYRTGGGKRVTLELQDGKQFTVNIPDDAWGDGNIYGLNLVFGRGEHYT